jgi:hypothetical protein
LSWFYAVARRWKLLVDQGRTPTWPKMNKRKSYISGDHPDGRKKRKTDKKRFDGTPHPVAPASSAVPAKAIPVSQPEPHARRSSPLRLPESEERNAPTTFGEPALDALLNDLCTAREIKEELDDVKRRVSSASERHAEFAEKAAAFKGVFEQLTQTCFALEEQFAKARAAIRTGLAAAAAV